MTTNSPSTPWHLWVVGVLALLWMCMGAFDFTMAETHNAEYLKALTPEQLAYIQGFPLWAVLCWGVSTWGGVLGALLLLLRRRWAMHAFALSTVTFVLTSLYNFVLTDGARIMGGAGNYWFAVIILAVVVMLFFYARRLIAQGVLR